MELKQNGTAKSLRIAITFNRTRMELKLAAGLAAGAAGALLIVPEWN